MFTKDKNREKKADRRPAPRQEHPGQHRERPAEEPKRRPPENTRRAPAEAAARRPAEGNRRAPAEAAARRPAEGSRKAPAEAAARRPAEGSRKAPAEAAARRPAEGTRKAPAEAAARRPAEGTRRAPAEAAARRSAEGARKAPAEAAGRRPAEGTRTAPAGERKRRPEDSRRAPGTEQRRRPAAARPEQPEQRRPVREPAQIPEQSPVPPIPAEQSPVGVPAVTGEEKVYEIHQAPRKTPATSRSADRSRPVPRGTPRTAGRRDRIPALKDAPQGTSYHRSTPREKKTLRSFLQKKTAKFYKDPDQQAAAARARQASREEKKKKLQKLAAKLDTPAIVYTQPKPFNRNRLLIQFISVLAVASALVMGLSIFFKVKYVTVSGAETYSTWAIQEASGIKEGDNLLTFGRARASGQITANLPYVEKVRIGIKLPDTVNIDVEEIDVAYSIKSGDGEWWLITSQGKVVRQIEGVYAKSYTEVLGVQLEKPVVNEQAFAREEVPEATGAEGEAKETESKIEAPITVTGAQRLKAALQILQALEANDIVGDAATVNVENLEKIELWYGQRYQVNLGDASNLDYKIACMYDAILQMSDYQTGMLDVSFTKKPDQVIYTPFV